MSADLLLSAAVRMLLLTVAAAVPDAGNDSIIDQPLLTDAFEANNSCCVLEVENGTLLLGNATGAKLGGNNQSLVAHLLEAGRFQIPLYSVIFLLAVIGNSLVILTLVQNKRMRTITNLFLLNLAVSDLFLGVFCMPFTLVGTLLRDFIFGEVMCKLLPYLQASSVAVSAWTLVIISVERYYAICHPLRSRRWQTLSHAYRLIALIWCGSLFFMLPIAALSKLIPTNQGHHKCRELWFDRGYERAYNLFLDVILLVLPLAILAVTYSLITRNLCRGMPHGFKRYGKTIGSCRDHQHHQHHHQQQREQQEADNGLDRSSTRSRRRWRSQGARNNNNNRAAAPDQYMEVYIRPNGSTRIRCPSLKCHRPPSLAATSRTGDKQATGKEINTSSFNNCPGSGGWSQHTATTMTTTTIQWPPEQQDLQSQSHSSYRSYSPASTSPGDRSGTGTAGDVLNGRESVRIKNPALRKSNMEKSLMNKKRIIKMLFVVVLEFFICWTPLYVINTMALFWPSTVYHNLGYTAISFFQLLAYSSSCCNPITYCFMSSGFRKAFLNLFRCFRLFRSGADSGVVGISRGGMSSRANRRASGMCSRYVSGLGTALLAGGGSGSGSSSSRRRNHSSSVRTMITTPAAEGMTTLDSSAVLSTQ
ncbi:cholecystokinin receptor type A-like [Sabethes cyaneus]|uniref:cholecystokinin receptor type A-like n=1 Tax=Sabethes cyaneus TaxID=53552 RepID=UPI00237D8B6E|nr:cholecystokinin receptor type A-like [Sabethes cyaneus]